VVTLNAHNMGLQYVDYTRDYYQYDMSGQEQIASMNAQAWVNYNLHRQQEGLFIEKAKLLINEKENMDSQLKLNVEYTNKSSAYGHSRIIKVTKNGSTVFRVDAIPFPECCGICIFKNISLSDTPRSEFTEMMNMIIKHLQEEDQFSMILMYSTDSSRIVKELSRFDGAIMTGIFRNRRSGNMLAGFEINIDPRKNRNAMVDDEDEDEPELDDELLEGDVDEDEDEGPFDEE